MADYYEQDQFPWHDLEVKQLREAIDVLGLSLPQDCLCLDIGGGRGQHASQLTGDGRRIYVSDVIEYSVLDDGAYAREVKALHQKYQRDFDLSNIIFLEMSAENLLFKDKLFDFVFSINAFEHIPNPFRAMDEIMRVLRPGGLLYISFDPIWTSPFGHHMSRIKDPWAHLLCSDDEIQQMILDNGGTAETIASFTNDMNRRSLTDYFHIFESVQQRFDFEACQFSWWPTEPADEPWCQHANYEKALAQGYNSADLYVRGFRFVGQLAA
jgi:SAM-dependent methyltransferase